LLLLGFAAAIPVILFAGWVAYVTAAQERALARRTSYQAVERVTERVASELSKELEVAETLAASSSLDEPNLRSFYIEAERLKSSRPLWETVELGDLNGTQVLNLLRPLGNRLGPTGDRESFDKVLQTREAAIGGIGPVGPISGKRLVAVRAPVVRAGDVKYVLTIHLAPDAVSSILRSAGAPPGWVGAIVDAKGNFVARSLAEEFEIGRPASEGVRRAIARSPEGSYVARTLEGVEVETVYRTLPNTGGWSVHLGVPAEVLNAPVRRSLFALAGGGLASLGLAGALALLTARDIAQRRRDQEARAMLALRKSEERWAVALAAADLGSWVWDPERDQILGSERCRALMNLPMKAKRGADWCWRSEEFLGVVHLEDRARLSDAIRSCLELGGAVDVEFRALREDGTTRWLRATGRAPSAGELPAVVHGVLSDIDPRKRAEAERAELLLRLNEAQENEQRRIARELHDHVGQTVTGLSIGLKRLEKAIDTVANGKGVVAQVRWLQGLTAKIGRDIHRAASDLRPTALDDLGLLKALATYVAEWSERFGIRVDLQVLGSGGGAIPPEVETAAYRIVQEALTNVLKHAGASSVSVVLERRGDHLRIIVEDDGNGFDPAQLSEPGDARPRLGLSGIRERLRLLGGKVTIESAPGAGTTLYIDLPTDSEQRKASA
jgi:signal transduction histidine kinase